MRTKILILAYLFMLILPLVSCDPTETDPTAADRDKYIGTWTVQESGKKKITYQVTITDDPSNSAQVLIANFYNFGITPYAIATSGTLTVPQQNFPASGIKVWGSGNYTTDQISWVYYVNDGANQDTIHSTYTRQ